MTRDSVFLRCVWCCFVKRSQIKRFIQLRESCPVEAHRLESSGHGLGLRSFRSQVPHQPCAFVCCQLGLLLPSVHSILGFCGASVAGSKLAAARNQRGPLWDCEMSRKVTWKAAPGVLSFLYACHPTLSWQDIGAITFAKMLGPDSRMPAVT